MGMKQDNDLEVGEAAGQNDYGLKKEVGQSGTEVQMMYSRMRQISSLMR